ncbi:M4 family metallopeptidase [Streptomyces sp. NPDC026672]|uniref:M4 family metallopeptidase n=1 Tax=unclassified Streptomyces TaxID=2593676 RepID=UPI0033EA5067
MRSHDTRAAAGAAVTTLALAIAALTGAPAGASPGDGLREGAVPLALSATGRAELLRDATAHTTRVARQLRLGGKEKLVVSDVLKDTDGSTHTRYDRTYDGLPVLGGDLVVHTTADGALESVTKATETPIAVATTTAHVTASAARRTALESAEADNTAKAVAESPRKVVWAADGKPVLAYETVVGGMQKDGTPNELHVITDAVTGAELYSYQGVHTGTGESQYSGEVTVGTTREQDGTYSLTDAERGGHKTYNLNRTTIPGRGTLFTDPDDHWGDGTVDDDQTAAVDVHYGVALTWDYYKAEHGRNGIRNDGVGSYSRVHYSRGYANAFWDDACFCMTYGDGFSGGGIGPMTEIDISAHEMTHGVTSATAQLVYSGESGGLNEATSDIFASAVEFGAGNPEDVGDYLLGEKIDTLEPGKPIRYMDEPSKDGESADAWYDGVGDLDVHFSSGIANHFFYLLSEGSGKKTINGVDYDSPTADGSTLTGIGRDKAAKIWYRALTTYMTSNTDYHAAREASLRATEDLYGPDSTEREAVNAAWAGVNVK